MELRARKQTSGAITVLLGLAPRMARRIEAGATERDAWIEDVKAGDLLRVRRGEKIPVDGVVTTGASAVDESMMTSEPIPLKRCRAAASPGSTVNGTVQSIGDRSGVYVPSEGEEGRFTERAVKLGHPAGDFIEAIEGVKAGERVVTEGSFFLRVEAARSRSGG